MNKSVQGRPLRVALALPQGPPFIERMLRGFAEFAREHGAWSFTRKPEGFDISLGWLRAWQGDGALVMITNREDARIAESLPYPVVNLASHIDNLTIPTVTVDNREVGRLAAEHLLERGFKRLGYYGVPAFLYSRLRCEGFRRAIEKARGACEVLDAVAGRRTL